MPFLHFKGKPFLKSYHHTVKFHRLIEDAKKSTSETPSLDDNLIIHGDNLQALKALLPTHAGKVKCIYIDPPYNTGNEGWAYNDNVNSPMIQKWLGQVVAKDDLSRHDKWCCMMYPRLMLLRELLREDGVIFVSIDDNEVQHLRMMMDEIFGEEDFITEIVWQKKQSPQNDATYFSDMHDFVLVYAKRKKEDKSDAYGWNRKRIARSEEQVDRYTNPDGDERGPWASVDCTSNKSDIQRPNLYYAVRNPIIGTDIWPPKQRVWRFEKNTFDKLIEEKRIWWGEESKNFPRQKKFLNESEEGLVPSTWWTREFAGDNQMARREIRTIFSEGAIDFDTPKPVKLISQIIKIACDKDDIILDSFAGSGTTAHAVLDLNKKDGGNRKFILVEMEDYADTISAERVRRVSRGVPDARDEKLREGLGGTFSYYELGDPIDTDAMLDGSDLPSFEDLAKYAFHTATGEKLDIKQLEPENYYVGSSKTFEVFMIYEPDKNRLKELALNSTLAEQIHARFPNKRKLVYAPCCYLEDWRLGDLNISFAQLPFEIYRIAA